MSLSGWRGQPMPCVLWRPARSAPDTHESRRLTNKPPCTLHRTTPATAPPPRHARRPDENSSASRQSDFTWGKENQRQERQFHRRERGARREEEKVAHPLGTSDLRADPSYLYPRSEDLDAPGSQTLARTLSLTQGGRGNPFLPAPTIPKKPATNAPVSSVGVPRAYRPGASLTCLRGYG